MEKKRILYSSSNMNNLKSVNRTRKLDAKIKQEITMEIKRKEMKKRKQERMRNQLAFLLGIAIIISFLVSGIHKAVISHQNNQEQVALNSLYAETEYDLSEYNFNANDPFLILVNANLPLDANYFAETVVADDSTGKKLEKTAAEAYRAMALAATADGVSLILQSGYRDIEYQTQLFKAKQQQYIDKGKSEEEAYNLAKTIVAIPGASEHATGLAADIVTEEYQNLDAGFASTKAFMWLNAYAADYGFVLRYPKDRQAITGIVYEPWHWRYVGIDNAKAIKQSGTCLEEFIEEQNKSLIGVTDPLV